MAETENILSTLFFFSIGIIIIFISFIGFTNYQQIDYTLDLNKYNYQKNYNKFESFTVLTDIYSKKNIFDTYVMSLANDMHYSTIYGDVSINESLKTKLDYLFGEENYFFKITPQIASIKFNILYDDGVFMKGINERENFSKIISEIRDFYDDSNLKISFEVFILSTETVSLECSKYQSIGIRCSTIEWSTLYKDYKSLAKKYDDFNLEDPVKNFNKLRKGFDKIDFQTDYYALNDWGTFMSVVSMLTYNEERSSSYSNKDVILLFTDEINLGGPNDNFYITSSMTFYDQDACETEFSKCVDSNFEREIAKLNERYEIVSVGTCAQACQNQHRGNDPAINACVGLNTDSGTWHNGADNCQYCDEKTGTTGQFSCFGYVVEFFCYDDYFACLDGQRNPSYGYFYHQQFCTVKDNFTISNYPVNESLKVLSLNSHAVFPVVIRDNTFREPAEITNYMKIFDESEYVTHKVSQDTGVVQGFSKGPELSGGNINTVCGKENCLGCYESPSEGIYHPETREHHLAQVNYVADETRGLVFMYDDSNFKESILDAIDDLLNRDIFEIGTKKEDENMQVFNKKILSEIGREAVLMDIYFELYPDLNYNFGGEMIFKPIVNNYQVSGNDLKIQISHNAKINLINLGEIDGTITPLEDKSIENILYVYEITFQNLVSSEEYLIFDYEDSLGFTSSFKMLNPTI